MNIKAILEHAQDGYPLTAEMIDFLSAPQFTNTTKEYSMSDYLRDMATEPGTRSKELAEAHWGYIAQLLTTHGTDDESMQIIGFHYRTAFEHGFKHGREEGDG